MYYLRQLVSIFSHLRKFNYVHLDLKPANLLLNEKWQLILADFGTALQINKPIELIPKRHSCREPEEDEGPVGTLGYVAPEALLMQKEKIGFGTDLWSFGVIIWQLFSDQNKTPFESRDAATTTAKTLDAKFDMPEGKHVTPQICDLIERLLVKEPTERLGAQRLQDLLDHPVFYGTNLDFTYDEEPALAARQKKLTSQKMEEMKYLPTTEMEN